MVHHVGGARRWRRFAAIVAVSCIAAPVRGLENICATEVSLVRDPSEQGNSPQAEATKGRSMGVDLRTPNEIRLHLTNALIYDKSFFELLTKE